MTDTEQQPTKANNPRIGVLVQACDGEEEIGKEALKSLIHSLDTDHLYIQIMDDASKGRVGEMLAEYCRELGVDAQCHRMEAPLGYRGIMIRCFKGLSILAKREPKLDYAIKIDTDTLFLGKKFGDFVKTKCNDEYGFYGVTHTLRKRDLLLLLSDLLPFGWRRKKANGQIQRKWSFSRLLPVWWTDIGYKAILRSRSFNTIITGGVYIITGPLLQQFEELGYWDRDVTKRYGFITSEEDTVISLMARAVKANVVEVNDLRPNFGEMRLKPGTSAQEIIDADYTVIHPLKRNEYSEKLRVELRELQAKESETVRA